jgi:hypothetical protein
MKKLKFKTKKYIKFDKKYYKISRNQLLILDALLYDGSNKKYIDSNNNMRYSEHFGLFDFDVKKLEKIIISGDTVREDEDDIEILFPNDPSDIIDYEFMFHTHPPTPGRVKNGIIYEFPSINDIFHFIEYFNKGLTQGSLIIAQEGIYVITTKSNVKKIKYNIKDEEKLFNILEDNLSDIHLESIEKYGKKFNKNFYYKTIIKDLYFINKFNNIIKEIFNDQIKIKYYNRTYDKKTNTWIIKSLFLRVAAIEPK